ncbi:unnamed protein product, partial [Chrysoparadoxa australica]
LLDFLKEIDTSDTGVVTSEAFKGALESMMNPSPQVALQKKQRAVKLAQAAERDRLRELEMVKYYRSMQ